MSKPNLDDPRLKVLLTASRRVHLPELPLCEAERKEGWTVATKSCPHPDPSWARHATVWTRWYQPPIGWMLSALYTDDLLYQEKVTNSFFSKIRKSDDRAFFAGRYCSLPWKP